MVQWKEFFRKFFDPSEPLPTQEYDTDELLPSDTDSQGTEYSDGFLQYFENGLRLRVNLVKNVTRIGSSWKDDCSVLSPTVHAGHAEIIRTEDQDGQYKLRNTGAAAGSVFLDGVPVPEDQPGTLSHGDMIRLGGMDFEFLKRSQLYGAGAAGGTERRNN